MEQYKINYSNKSFSNIEIKLNHVNNELTIIQNNEIIIKLYDIYKSKMIHDGTIDNILKILNYCR